MSGLPMAAIGAANDPRLENNGLDATSYPNRVLQKLHDPNVTLEEYMYHAKLTRTDEDRLYGPGSDYQQNSGPATRFIKEKIWRTQVAEREMPPPRLSISAQGEGQVEGKALEQSNDATDSKDSSLRASEPIVITDEEWLNASRAARTATWASVFYLITTDILGPFSTGWSYAQLGYGPGITLFTVFGALSGYTGYQLWRMFMQMDSDRFPLKGYGDIAFRVYGSWFRHICNVLQSFQFLLSVSLIIITSGQSISQMSKANLCFIICVVVSAIAGCIIGQIRTLQRFGWLASLAVYMNLLVIICTMGVMAHSPPNYAAIAASYPSILPDINNPAPIYHSAGLPPGLPLVTSINGLMLAVFSFGGATLFCELIAEMRRPMDFWKGLLCAELLIYTCYMVYGVYCYALQGQYVYPVSYQGVSPYAWQTFGNVFGLITGILAACLYGNIGIKVLYNNVGRDLLRFPILESRKGKLIWIIFVPLYWLVALILAASIPQIANFQALVGAACILQFTYTFPPFLMIGFKTQRDAILPQDTFDPATGRVTHVDSGIKRWIRGYKKELAWNLFDTFFWLGSCTTAVLGIYAAIDSMHTAYTTNPNLTAWSCKSPTG